MVSVVGHNFGQLIKNIDHSCFHMQRAVSVNTAAVSTINDPLEKKLWSLLALQEAALWVYYLLLSPSSCLTSKKLGQIPLLSFLQP